MEEDGTKILTSTARCRHQPVLGTHANIWTLMERSIRREFLAGLEHTRRERPFGQARAPDFTRGSQARAGLELNQMGMTNQGRHTSLEPWQMSAAKR